MRLPKVIITSLCMSLLIGCTNIEMPVEAQESIVLEGESLETEEAEMEKQEQEQEESKKVVETLTIDETVYTIIYDYTPDTLNSSQLWKTEDDGTQTLLDEGIHVQIIRGTEGFYTCVLKMIDDNNTEGYIKKYSSVEDLEGQYILEDKVDFENTSIYISSSINRGYMWCVVEEQKNRVLLLNDKDEILLDTTIEVGLQEELRLEPYGWSGENTYLWCISLGTYDVNYYTIINTRTFEVQTIKMDENYHAEYALNPSNGWIVYSNIPKFFDTESLDEFMASGKEVTLYLKNLFTKETITLATSVTKDFYPKWIDRYTIEYNNPNQEDRLTYKLPEAKDLECLQEVQSILLESTEFLAECIDCYKELGSEKAIEIADSIASRLEEAYGILSNHEFHRQDKKIKDAIAYYKQTLPMLLEQAHIISEQGADKATVDTHAVEEESGNIVRQALVIIDPEYYEKWQ